MNHELEDAPEAPSDDQALPNPYEEDDFDGDQVGHAGGPKNTDEQAG